MPFETELQVAKLLAQEAGSLASDYQRRGVVAESKSDESPVTAADRACEKMIVETLSREFPDDGVLGEEGANRESGSGRRWIIDPIDGTRDFVRNIPLWAVLIGLEEKGEVVAGVAHCPRQNLLVWASKDNGAFANGERIQVSTKATQAEAVCSFNGFQKASTLQFAPNLVEWLNKFWAVRSLGGAVDAMLVAQGFADVWIEPSAAPWDLAPLKIITQEAGGKFSTFAGESSIYGGNAYTCTPRLESCVHELLNGTK